MAGDLLSSARLKTGLSQAKFALMLSEVLGFDVLPESVHYYQAGANTVPAAVLLAACAVSGQPIRVQRVKARTLRRSNARSTIHDRKEFSNQ